VAGVQLAVEQAHQVGGAGDPAQLPLGLQVALQRSDGQAAGAGAHQVDLAGAGDRPADVHRFFHRLDVGRQAPFAVAHIGVAPADHERLQAVLERVLDEAVVRAEVENVVLVDLRRHHQQRLGVLLFAHRLVLDQLQQLVAKHHGASGGGDGLADLECLFGDLAGQAVVVQQVIDQVTRPRTRLLPPELNSSLTASGLSRLLDGATASLSRAKAKCARARSSSLMLLSSIQLLTCFCQAR
jgi:AcrR family transcriptional regulator